MINDNGERVVLCFDRDHTVSVNPHPSLPAVPLGWVQYWAHKTDIPVWATGNQHLCLEAEIPGIKEAEKLWERYVGDGEYEYPESRMDVYSKPRRKDGLRLIQDLYQTAFPEEDFRFIVVDDVDVSDLSKEGPWTHYLPWNFHYAMNHGRLDISRPPKDAFRNSGVPFNSTRTPDFTPDRSTPLERIRNRCVNGHGEP